VSSAQWGFAANASTVDLNALQPLNRVAEAFPGNIDLTRPDVIVREAIEAVGAGETRWKPEGGIWLADVMALVVLTGVFLLATAMALRRHDPGVT
jgi:hypothetical protein